MHKGLYSALWVLFFTLITACGPKPDPKPDPIPIPIPEPPSEISVTGKIMLGPVVRGHSLKLVIYDADMKELDRPKVGLDGSYGFKLKDYKGVIIAQVTSENPDQCSGDYIDEATAKPKCLGKSTILSSTYVQSGTSDNQAKLHTTPVTTVAVLHAGVVLDDNGGLTVPKGLTQDRITQSNKAVAKVFGLGDQSIAEYTPTSIITTDQKFKTGDAYTKALAAISGVEDIDKTKNLNNVLKQISSAISTDAKNPALNPALQDTMVKGLQKVAEKIKANSGDKTILKNLSKYQDKFPKSIIAVDLTKTLPEPPSFTDETKTKTKTTILKPTWHWKPDNTGNTKYQYRVGEADRTWKDIAKNKFTPSENLKRGKHTLIIRQANVNKATLWSKPTQLTIEIVPNTEGDVSITGTFQEYQKLTAKVSDRDGEPTDISYQWYRNNQKIPDTNKSDYTLVQDDTGKVISVKVMYKDKEGNNENIISIPTPMVENINDRPEGNPTIDGLIIHSGDESNAVIGNKLKASIESLNDKDGIDENNSNLTYKWYLDNQEISSKKEFTPTQDYINQKIMLKVVYTDKHGHNEEAKSGTFSIIDKKYPPQLLKEKITIKNINKLGEGTIDLSETAEDLNSNDQLSLEITKFPIKGVLTLNNKTITKVNNQFKMADSINLTYKRQLYGEDTFEFRAFDGEFYNENSSAKVVILYKDLEPVIKDPNEDFFSDLIQFDENDEGKTYKISVTDYDSSVSNIDIDTVSSLASISIQNDSTETVTQNFLVKITPKKNKFGTEIITIKAVSGGQEVKKDFKINIKPQQIMFREISSEINVCWEQITDVSSKINIPVNPSQKAENKKGYIEETINNSWGKNTAINFKWHKNGCPEDKRTLKIAFTEDDTQEDKQAIYLPNLNAIIFPSNVQYRRTIIHEFGHALGFPDEHARLDVYRGGSYEQADNGKVCTQIVNGTPILAEGHEYYGKEREELGLKVVSMTDWQKQPYNPFSVMNDCTSAEDYNNKFIDEVKKIFLSDDDINRAQQFYGAPLGAHPTRHFMKDGDQFFTGLFRNASGSGYDFYKYGVKNDTYNIDKIASNINDYQDGDYFYISKKSEYQETKSISDNEILFQYSKVNYFTPQNHAMIICSSNADVNNYFDANECFNQSRMTTSSLENYDIYYNDFYGRKNEFNIMLCEKREDIDINNTTYKFVKINNDRCIDDFYSRFISAFPRISQYFSDNFLSDNFLSAEQLPIYKTFIKGKGMSGFLTQDVDIKMQDSKFIFPGDYLEVDNEKNYIRYVSDKLPLTGFISEDFSMFFNEPFPSQSFDQAFLLRLEKLAKMKPGYYVNGVHIHNDKIYYNNDKISWNENSDETITIVQKNIYAFVNTADGEGEGETEKLYKNGELYSGEFDSNNYNKGVLEQ